MTNNSEKIELLLKRLNQLIERQNQFQEEIAQIKSDLIKLKADETSFEQSQFSDHEIAPLYNLNIKQVETSHATVKPFYKPEEKETQTQNPKTKANRPPQFKSDLEKFIGENLINKIGIAITVIGVVIGAKYSIEHELISPLTRIILGYLTGLGLLGFGMKLKKNYNNYSAVLVSGAMAILYFITFVAYSFYGLFPQAAAFGLMVIFTVFTVVASLSYNQKVIALIGLVGAYAVPFLLSNGSGKVAILFGYMVIINSGILVLAFKKYWKELFYAAFGFTWIIFISWYGSEYVQDKHFQIAVLFSFLFYILFYITFLAYKVVRKEQFIKSDVLLLISNSFIYFGLGYAILDHHFQGQNYLGLFTLANAVVHFAMSALIFRQKLADKNLFFMVAGLVLVFITIAIPVQLDGNWVTLLWSGEAALLFWIGRTKSVSVYEKLSYYLMFLAFGSLLHDWSFGLNRYYPDQPNTRVTPFLNIPFISNIIFVLAFGLINYINQLNKYASVVFNKKWWGNLVRMAMPGILLFSLYAAYRFQIQSYWQQLYVDSGVITNSLGEVDFYGMRNTALLHFKELWLSNYTLVFMALLTFFNIKKLKHENFGWVNIILNVLAIALFLVNGLFQISELRELYLQPESNPNFTVNNMYLYIRYISIGFLILPVWACFKLAKQDFMQFKNNYLFDGILHITTLWVLSSELISWMDMAHSEQEYKLALSILWGVYALLLVSLGIAKNKKHLRFGGIVLFALTLIKLFVYDIAHLNTISKTIVFVSLGILLLVISFLYNKYKHLMVDETEN